MFETVGCCLQIQEHFIMKNEGIIFFIRLEKRSVQIQICIFLCTFFGIFEWGNEIGGKAYEAVILLIHIYYLSLEEQ